MSRVTTLSRRALLRGLGTAVALPWLEAMTPRARAAQIERPRRLAFLYVPNGIHMPDWTPQQEGAGFDLPPILKPLEPFRDDLLVLTGLTQDNANAKGDGPGDHARALAAFLTGVHPRKTDGANIKAGISVDQVAAQKIGHHTRFRSLELGCDPSAQAGNCDSGYSCAYSSNIAWSSESTPLSKEINPRLVFDRLFGATNPAELASGSQRRLKSRQSVLDFVGEDARRLRDRLGATDKRKLDEYLTGVREIERRLAQSDQTPVTLPDGATRPSGIPTHYPEHVRLMCDMIALAFQADLTRVVTFVLANEGSNRSYGWLDVNDGHHELSHHGRDAEKQSKIAKINTFHIEHFAYLLGKLKSAQDGETNVLDNSMIVYGSGIGDGDRHNHNDLPILLAGRGSGTIKTGRHIRYPENTPLNNLFLSMLDRVDSRVDSLGDSSGTLAGLDDSSV